MNISPADIARQLRQPLRDSPQDRCIWPAAEWQRLVEAGVTGWTVPSPFSDHHFSSAAVLEGCRELARANLSVTFILSQFQAACQRLAACDNAELQALWLPRLARGEAFATVGISHLTTSRQHVATPAVTAEATNRGYVLNGMVPWVTGAEVADILVLGGTLPDGRQILAAIPRKRFGVMVAPPERLLALNDSLTASVQLDAVTVSEDELLAGPVPQVLSTLSGKSSGAGSLTTSALALGHAEHALDRLSQEAAPRPALQPNVDALSAEANAVAADLQVATGSNGTPESLRTRATSLTLRAAQAYLAAAKGAGYVVGHPAERLVREAMFFLVWSCPQAVANQLLGEFSRCEDV